MQVKTKSIKQLEKEFGKDWRKVVGWNYDGKMDHLANKLFKNPEISKYSGSFFYNCPKSGAWYITKKSYVNYSLAKSIEKILKY